MTVNTLKQIANRNLTTCQADLLASGAGDVNWHSLITVFSSEMLKFEEEQRQLEEAANALALERPHTPPSRKGSGSVEQLSSPRGTQTAALLLLFLQLVSVKLHALPTKFLF